MSPLKESLWNATLQFDITDRNLNRSPTNAVVDSALKILKSMQAEVQWYGGRYIWSSESRGRITFYELIEFAHHNDLCDSRILDEIDRLENATKNTNLFQDLGTFIKKLPYRISLLFRKILCCCCWPKKTKTEMMNELRQLQLSYSQVEESGKSRSSSAVDQNKS